MDLDRAGLAAAMAGTGRTRSHLLQLLGPIGCGLVVEGISKLQLGLQQFNLQQRVCSQVQLDMSTWAVWTASSAQQQVPSAALETQ